MSAKKQFSLIGWALSVFYLVTAAGQLLVGLLLQRFDHLFPELVWNEDFLMILSLVVMYGIGFPGFWLMIRRLPSWFKEEQETLTPGSLILTFIVCLGSAYAGNIIGIVIMTMSELMFGVKNLNPVTDTFVNMTPEVMFLTTVMIAPIMEELMFRKLLIDRLIPWGQKMAVLVSGLAFALFHGNFYQFFYAWSLGMIFAYLYSRTGRLRYSVLMHMGINFTGGLLPLLLERWAGWNFLLSWLASVFLSVISLSSIVAAIVLMALFGGRLTWYLPWKRAEKGMFHAVVTASGVWVFLLICASEFARMW